MVNLFIAVIIYRSCYQLAKQAISVISIHYSNLISKAVMYIHQLRIRVTSDRRLFQFQSATISGHYLPIFYNSRMWRSGLPLRVIQVFLFLPLFSPFWLHSYAFLQLSFWRVTPYHPSLSTGTAPTPPLSYQVSGISLPNTSTTSDHRDPSDPLNGTNILYFKGAYRMR